MRRRVLILGGLVVVGLGLGLLFSGGKTERTLSDGSIIRVEKVTFAMAEDDEFVLGGIAGKLKLFAREAWANVSHSPARQAGGAWSDDDSNLHTNVPALYVYVSRRVPGKGYRNVDAPMAVVIDEDGCVFQSVQAGGIDDGQIAVGKTNRFQPISDVGWFRFEAFPRREKKFRFIVAMDTFPTRDFITTNSPTAEFLISNPVKPSPPADWSVEPIPITHVQGGVSFTLASMQMVTNSDPDSPPGLATRSAVPKFEYAENGKPSTNWQAFIEGLSDASGNFAGINEYDDFPYPLCPREASWKFRVKFFGDESSPSASNAVWTLPQLAVPGPANSIPLSFSNTLQGVSIRVGAIGGRGNFTYSNALVLGASRLRTSESGDVASIVGWPPNWPGSNSVLKPTFSVRSSATHLAITADNLTPDQKLTVRAVDDQGRIFYGRRFGLSAPDSPSAPNYLKDLTEESGGCFAFLDLPADAKTVELILCVHTGRSAEFIFKPPQTATSHLK